MKLVKVSRKLHKWLMLFLGIQFLIWSISGAYMVILNIHYIHGDSLVVNHQTKIEVDKVTYSLASLIDKYPEAKDLEVGTFLEQVVYRFSQADDKYLVNASDGKQISPLSPGLAIKAASHFYAGSGEVVKAKLITDNPPFELSSRVLPAWRINFDDFASPSIYISAQTGELVTKRHEFWRIFDLMFALHVMDYEEQDISNQLLFWFALFSILAVILGAVLSYFVIFKSPRCDMADAKIAEVNNVNT